MLPARARAALPGSPRRRPASGRGGGNSGRWVVCSSLSLCFRWPPGRASQGRGGEPQPRAESCGGRGSPEACPGAGAGAAPRPTRGRTPPQRSLPRAKENSRLLGGAGRGAGQAATASRSHPRPGRPPPPSPRPSQSKLAFCLFVGELEGVCESNPMRRKLRLRVGIRVLHNAPTASALPKKCST